MRKWERKGRLPQAVVIEHPRLAGDHLGAARVEDLNECRFDFECVIPETLAFRGRAGVERDVPVIAAGGCAVSRTSHDRGGRARRRCSRARRTR